LFGKKATVVFHSLLQINPAKQETVVFVASEVKKQVLIKVSKN